MVMYDLPRLPYNYDELEPHIDAKTMRIHHLEHHRECVDGLNRALDDIQGASHPQYISAILSDLGSVPESGRDAVRFFGGGFENHRLFWETITPRGGGSPGGSLEDAISVYYGSFDIFQKAFTDAALSIQGSGWCWLVFDPTYSRIEILTTANNDSPWSIRRTPLLVLDVWEHAYYLRYEGQRSDYIRSWWNVINWDHVCSKYSHLTG